MSISITTEIILTAALSRREANAGEATGSTASAVRRNGGRGGSNPTRCPADGSGTCRCTCRLLERGCSGHPVGWSSVPVSFRIAHTFAHCYTLVALLDHEVKHEASQVISSLVMDIVSDR